MRFRLGPIPEDPDFEPAREGWLRIREPDPLAIQVIALPLALGALLVSGALMVLIVPGGLLALVRAMAGLPAWAWLVVLVAAIPVHEAIHAGLHPDWGLSEHSVIGLWPGKAVFYAHYQGAVARNRLLLVLAGPYMVLGLLPICLLALPVPGGWDPNMIALLGMLSLIGTLLASGDLMSFVLLALLVPPGAVVRNQGWRTYWKNTPLHRPGAGQVGEG